MITNNPNGNQFWQIPSASIQVLFGPLVVHNVGVGNTIAQTLSQTQIHGLRLLSSVKCHFHMLRFYSALLNLFSPGPLHQSPSNWSVPSPFLNQNHLTPDLFAATPWFAEIKRWLAKIPPIDKSGKGQAGYWWCDHWWWCQWFTCCVTSMASPPPPPCPPPLIWRQSLLLSTSPCCGNSQSTDLLDLHNHFKRSARRICWEIIRCLARQSAMLQKWSHRKERKLNQSSSQNGSHLPLRVL